MKVMFAILLILPCQAFGQYSNSYKSCSAKATTQIDINACASHELAKADSELNVAYQKLLASASEQAGATAKIKLAEKAWIAFRDAYIEAMYPADDKQAEYGSMYPTDVGLLGADLTYQQLANINRLMKEFSSSN